VQAAQRTRLKHFQPSSAHSPASTACPMAASQGSAAGKPQVTWYLYARMRRRLQPDLKGVRAVEMLDVNAPHVLHGRRGMFNDGKPVTQAATVSILKQICPDA
jgi:hypothetical protein